MNCVILKRLSDALHDQDPIRAVIRGWATNSDGKTLGISTPDANAQAECIKAAYRIAGIDDLGATSYVECHGTGTPVGLLSSVSIETNTKTSCRQEMLLN